MIEGAKEKCGTEFSERTSSKLSYNVEGGIKNTDSSCAEWVQGENNKNSPRVNLN